ncbi:MAG: enoyl-CoA hydratase/isomerase family protein [Burkholderiaceae bacterium]|nr:enoyl-CoA hydratase/isomerase family protein [Ideonella sp.]MCC7287637.1 enoyl-CoA hydratase/isomerase family protein [Burkholderiaceae bacterium]
MDQYFDLTSDPRSGVAELVLNQPQRLNTIAPAFFTGLRDAVRELDDAGTTRVLVIRSTGKHFCAGMALEVFDDLAQLDASDARSRLAFQRNLRRLMDCFDALEQARFPVLCAVQGGCIGGGLDLALACDIRVCSADAFFTVQEIHIGLAADVGSLQRLPKVVPQGIARQMAYTGERLDAPRALATGLVNAVLPDAQALQVHATQLARQIAEKNPLAIAGSKLALNYARDHGTDESLQQMALLQSAIFDLGDIQRAIAAWKDKRAGQFDALAATPPP